MKSTQQFHLCIIFAWVVMILSFFMLFNTTIVHAQSNPVPTPDPTVQALENSVEQQAQEIEFLNERLILTEEQFEVSLQRANFIALVFGIAGIGGVVGGIVSWWNHFKGMQELDEKFRKRMVELEDAFEKKEAKLWKQFSQKMQTKFEEELYGLDATMLTVRIREGEHKEKLARRLELSGFKNVQTYREFGKHMLKGITIVPVGNKKDEDEFSLFINEYGEKLDSTRTAFVIYATGNYRVDPKTLEVFENLSLANTPTSLATNILAVGRGLMP